MEDIPLPVTESFHNPLHGLSGNEILHLGNKFKPGVWKAAFFIVVQIPQTDQLITISLQLSYSSQSYYQEKSKLPREDNKYFQNPWCK